MIFPRMGQDLGTWGFLLYVMCLAYLGLTSLGSGAPASHWISSTMHYYRQWYLEYVYVYVYVCTCVYICIVLSLYIYIYTVYIYIYTYVYVVCMYSISLYWIYSVRDLVTCHLRLSWFSYHMSVGPSKYPKRIVKSAEITVIQ